MENILKFLALLSSGMFAGAAFYLTTVEHPARMSVGRFACAAGISPQLQTRRTATGLLAIVCFLCGVSLAMLTQHWLWLLGGILRGSRRAVYISVQCADQSVASRRGQAARCTDAGIPAREMGSASHAVRTVLSVLGFLVLLWACVFHP